MEDDWTITRFFVEMPLPPPARQSLKGTGLDRGKGAGGQGSRVEWRRWLVSLLREYRAEERRMRRGVPSRSNGGSSPKANGLSSPSLLPTPSRTPQGSGSRSAFGYIRQHLFRTNHDRASVGEDTLPPRRKSDRVFAWFSISAEVESEGKRQSDFHWLR